MREPAPFRVGGPMKILVLGATGMLGNAMFRALSQAPDAVVHGTLRQEAGRALFAPQDSARLMVVGDLENSEHLARLFDAIRPDVVVNCVLPQRLSLLCRMSGARLIQISSDGIFSGNKGSYTEDDLPDATDIYGISKLLGEVSAPYAITLRTSIIGHELQSRDGLLEWFVSQENRCRGYTRAIFSGFPTIVLAGLIRDVVIPRPDLQGVYHLATRPISKFDLLQLVANRYGKKIEVTPDDRANPDRSLVADRFERATGYVAPDWPTLVDLMYSDRFGAART
jgi:dTDP-4-dehydrorhamnose reductase